MWAGPVVAFSSWHLFWRQDWELGLLARAIPAWLTCKSNFRFPQVSENVYGQLSSSLLMGHILHALFFPVLHLLTFAKSLKANAEMKPLSHFSMDYHLSGLRWYPWSPVWSFLSVHLWHNPGRSFFFPLIPVHLSTILKMQRGKY